MGKFFLMSHRFDKKGASDFGLEPLEFNYAIDPDDRSIWESRKLYDFGWGAENGYCKLPIPNFEALLELVLFSENKDDVYGAASIIMEDHSDNFLEVCECISSDKNRVKDFKRLVKLFDLCHAINRSSILCKSYEQVEDDYSRWCRISELAMRSCRRTERRVKLL